MVALESIRASNAQCGRLSGLVGVYVGSSSGIGESTAKELFKSTRNPRLYVIGRTREKCERVVAELIESNPEGAAFYIQKDLTLIRNVDEVCAEIKRRESKINSLFITAGFMTMKGRQESIEGLDTKMAVNYYSRIRFAQQLMPLLEAAASAHELARVTTVLAAGSEHKIHVEDLDLKHNYSLHCSLAHCVVMTDFALEELSRRHPAVSFMHCYPGTIKTGIANQLTGPIRLAAKIFYSLMTPWILNVSESGERHLFQVTSVAYRSPQNDAGVPLVEGVSIMKSSLGDEGGGVYLLDWNSDALEQKDIMNQYREQGLPKKVWEHTMEAFGRMSKKRTLAVAEMLS